MSGALFRTDPYLRSAEARVTAITENGGVILDRCLFYPTGGGQPGDTGQLDWEGGSIRVANSIKGPDGAMVLVPEAGDPPPIGADVAQELDWERRYAHMRMHTALHLLSVVIPLPVTGGAIGAEKGRLDFKMPEPPEDRNALEKNLNALVIANHAVAERWISEKELDARPDLVKTMSVQPPRGVGKIRLVRIGPEEDPVDLQPCGGTHVARTGEIGHLRLGKIEKKGRQNRRVAVSLA